MDMSRIAYGLTQPTAGKGRAVPDAQPKRTGTGAPAPASPSPPTAEGAQPPQEALQQLLQQVSQHINPEQRSLSFEVSEELGRAVVSVYDTETKELIRQIPSETLVRIATTMQEIAQQGGDGRMASGLLLSEQA
jgi:flagellar protein FlaG